MQRMSLRGLGSHDQGFGCLVVPRLSAAVNLDPDRPDIQAKATEEPRGAPVPDPMCAAFINYPNTHKPLAFHLRARTGRPAEDQRECGHGSLPSLHGRNLNEVQ